MQEADGARADPGGATVPTLELHAEAIPLAELFATLRRRLDLLPLLARQHFRGQYRAARLGVAWSALQPLVRGAVLAVVFTQFVPIEGTPVPYPAFVLGGTAIWAFVSAGVTEGTTAITSSSELASRVYFPRLLLPAMPAAAGLPSLLITLVLVILLSLAFGVVPGWPLLLLPLAIGLAFVLVVVLSANLALLHVYFRDVGPLVRTGMSVAFYATPIIYPTDLADQLRPLLEANPFTGPVVAVRWSLFGGQEEVGAALWWTAGWIVVLVVTAALAYRRHERVCVDRL